MKSTQIFVGSPNVYKDFFNPALYVKHYKKLLE